MIFKGSPYTYYSLLELPKEATEKEIKKAFKRLAKEYHPDKNDGNDTVFKEINEAYEILSKNKAEYDNYSEQKLEAEAESVFKKEEPSNFFYSRNTFKDFFKDTFKNFRREFSDIWSDKISDDINNALAKAENEFEKLKKENPFAEQFKAILNAERHLRIYGSTETSIKNALAKYKEFYQDLDDSFWLQKITSPGRNKKKNKSKKIVAPIHLESIEKNILESWKKDVQKSLKKFLLNSLQKQRMQLSLEIRQKLQALRKISIALKPFQLFGLGYDLSLGSLVDSDIQELLKWKDFFENNPKVLELCEMLGRMQKEKRRWEYIKSKETYTYDAQIPDISSQEEITGVKFGNDIENVLPQELALLSDTDTEILFDLKFIEKQLMCFEKIGLMNVKKEGEREIEKKVEKKDKKGPIILCVDTSGSMAGTPENIAKAIALTMSMLAKKQNRNCYMINFSTNIETFDFGAKKDIKELIRFLKQSFHGGTDVMRALEEALKIMENENYKKADLLVVSDFIFSPENSEIEEKIIEQKKKENKFYGLSILNNENSISRAENIFDALFTYQISNGNIKKLYNHLVKISRREN